MSELNSSDNNSISENNNNSLSENISIDENTSNHPESMNSLSSPSSQKLDTFDDFNKRSSDLESNYSSNKTNSEQDISNAHDLMSLPAMSSTSTSTTRALFGARTTLDPELSGLLTRKQPRFIPQAPKCAKCDKNVYKAEEIRAANKTFHKLCFKCTSCNKLLETNILTEHQGDLYCRVCYGRNFGPKGYGYGAGTAGILSTESPNTLNNNSSGNSPVYITANSSLKCTFTSYKPVSRTTSITDSPNNSVESKENQDNSTETKSTPKITENINNQSNGSLDLNNANKININISNNNNNAKFNNSNNYQMSAMNHEKRNSTISLSSVTYGGSDRCARCLKAVYAAEKVVAAGKPYHKLCFSCTNCKKLLNSMNCCDNSDGDVFCKSCYGRQYGPKGIGVGYGSGALEAKLNN